MFYYLIAFVIKQKEDNEFICFSRFRSCFKTRTTTGLSSFVEDFKDSDNFKFKGFFNVVIFRDTNRNTFFFLSDLFLLKFRFFKNRLTVVCFIRVSNIPVKIYKEKKRIKY